MSDPEKKPDPAEPEETPPAAGTPPSTAEAPLPEPTDETLEDLDQDAQDVLDEVDVRDLLRSALAPPPGAVAPDLLHGVQRKLRRRSRGKFYGDGWSTARTPRSTYFFTSLLMLALIGFVFLVLIPWGSGALP